MTSEDKNNLDNDVEDYVKSQRSFHKIRSFIEGLSKTTKIKFLSLIVLLFISTRFFTIFVIPPIGAIPEGKTLIISRNSTEFLDSADAICIRNVGYVSPLCRWLTLDNVIINSTVYLKLPYSETLDDWSKPNQVRNLSE